VVTAGVRILLSGHGIDQSAKMLHPILLNPAVTQAQHQRSQIMSDGNRAGMRKRELLAPKLNRSLWK
jgi:hypothetical protein